MLFLQIIKVLRYLVARFIGSISPRFNKIVFGAWMGEAFSDSPKYLFTHLLENTDFTLVWVGKKNVEQQIPRCSRVIFAEKGSLKAFFHLATSRVWFCCQNSILDFGPFSPFTRSNRLKILNAWHGIPIKKLGEQQPLWKTSGVTVFERIWHDIFLSRPEWAVVASEKMAEILAAGYPRIFNASRCYNFGTPRNDFLINNRDNYRLIHALRQKYSKLIGFSPNKKIVLYLPTWRASGASTFSFMELSGENKDKLADLLKENSFVLIEKTHYIDKDIAQTKSYDCFLRIPNGIAIDTQELLLITDILISDYSGAFVDFGLLGRPAIHYAYDLEDYVSAGSGLSYDLEKVSIGPILKDYSSLCSYFSEKRFERGVEYGVDYKQVVGFEIGTSSAQILDLISMSCGGLS